MTKTMREDKDKWVKFIWDKLDVVVKEKDAEEFRRRLVELDAKVKSLNKSINKRTRGELPKILIELTGAMFAQGNMGKVIRFDDGKTSLERAEQGIWNWHISQLQRDRERVIEEFAKIVDKYYDKDFGTYDYKQIAEDFISEINSLRKK